MGPLDAPRLHPPQTQSAPPTALGGRTEPNRYKLVQGDSYLYKWILWVSPTSQNLIRQLMQYRANHSGFCIHSETQL